MGCEVRTFNNPETALEGIYTIAPPELIITDYAMGRMNGMDLISECHRINPHQKVLLVSGTVDEHVFADSLVRPDRFLSQAVSVHTISPACVRELLAAKILFIGKSSKY